MSKGVANEFTEKFNGEIFREMVNLKIGNEW
jgi:hypothetical protein